MAKKKKMSFKGKVTQNSHKQKSQGDSFNHLRLPKGLAVYSPDVNTRVRLDFLPYEVTSHNHLDRDDEYGIAVPGEYWYKKPYYRHRDIGSGNESVICPSTEKKKCPICEYRAKLMKEGADWNDETVKALRPSLRNLYAVVIRGHKDYEEKPYLLDISQFCFQQQLNEEIEEDEAHAVFPDPDEGLTVKIRFSEASIGKTKFPEASRIDFVERAKPISDKMLARVPKLDELLVIPTYAALEAMFYGGLDRAEAEADDDDYDEEDEDEIIDDDVEVDEDDHEEVDDDYDEEDEEDEDDVEVDDDDDYDEEDDVDEEEEPPAKPVKPARTAKAPAKAPAKPAPKAKAKPAPVSKATSKPTKASAKNKCPHGHRFGVDCEEYDECDECELWEECFDAKG